MTDTPRPEDTATHTYDRSITLPDGVPTVTWTIRLKTQEELDSDVSQTNRDTLTTRARSAYAANRNYLAIATPTAAQVRQQTDTLTKQMQGLIRMLIAPDLLSDPVVD